MVRVYMHQICDSIYGFGQGESDRQVARDLGLKRHTVKKYWVQAGAEGFLASEETLPMTVALAAALGPPTPRLNPVSTVAPDREVVDDLHAQGVQLTAILARLYDDYRYRWSYSSLRRYLQATQSPPDLCLRARTKPGEGNWWTWGPSIPWSIYATDVPGHDIRDDVVLQSAPVRGAGL